MEESYFLAHRENSVFRDIETNKLGRVLSYDSLTKKALVRYLNSRTEVWVQLNELELVEDKASNEAHESVIKLKEELRKELEKREAVKKAKEEYKRNEEQDIKTSPTGGMKEHKEARFDLIPSYPLHSLAVLYGRGAKKYSERNWEAGFPYSWSLAAIHRHLNLFEAGEDFDSETGVLHLINAAFHCFAVAEFFCRGTGTDDRPYKNSHPIKELVRDNTLA